MVDIIDPESIIRRTCSDAGADGALIRKLVMKDDRNANLFDLRALIGSRLRAAGWSYPMIARSLGKKNHTSAMNWCGSVTKRKP